MEKYGYPLVTEGESVSPMTKALRIPYLGLHNAHALLALKISRKKLVRVYNAHGLSIKGKYLQVQNKTTLDSFNSSIIKTW